MLSLAWQFFVQGKYSNFLEAMVARSEGAIDSAQLIGFDGKELTSVSVSILNSTHVNKPYFESRQQILLVSNRPISKTEL